MYTVNVANDDRSVTLAEKPSLRGTQIKSRQIYG